MTTLYSLYAIQSEWNGKERNRNQTEKIGHKRTLSTPRERKEQITKWRTETQRE